MTGLLKHPLRVTGRVLWIMAELSFAAFSFMAGCAFRRRHTSLRQRAAWLQQTCRRLLRIFRTVPQVSGPIPTQGLLVCNHLSYLDILVLASISPSVFVAKHEVKSWPVFGWFARMGGTMFVDRDRRTQVGQVTRAIQSALKEHALVVLFPEGTSSGGETVLPFKTSLLEPATRQTHTLFAGALCYELDDGDVREEVCYWKDMVLPRHMLNLCSKRQIRVEVRFSEVHDPGADRKELAGQLHAEVLRLRTEMLSAGKTARQA